MERNIFALLASALDGLEGAWARPSKATFTDRDIVLTFFWGVLHDRSVDWACRRGNWPFHDRKRALPSGPTMSRRLREPSVLALIDATRVALRAIRAEDDRATANLDAKPVTVSGHSQDKSAGYGRAGRIFTRGYKLHDIADPAGNVEVYEVLSLKVSEQAAARGLLAGYTPRRPGVTLLADANYDSSELYDLAAERGVQLVAGKRYKHAKGLGHVYQSPHRLKGLAMQARDPRVLEPRRRIEGQFGTMGNVVGGLAPLPNFVRGLTRVRRWIAAKLAIDAAHRFRRINNATA